MATFVATSLAGSWAKDAEGVYRATLTDGRSVWAWCAAVTEWRYGLVVEGEDVPNAYSAPRRHLATADCLDLAGWLRPGAVPRQSPLGPHWTVNPATGEGAEQHNPPGG